MKHIIYLIQAKTPIQPVNSIVRGLGLLAYVLIVFSPILILLIESIKYIITDSDWLEVAIPTGRRFGIFLRTVSLSAAVAICGMIMGFFIGIYLWRWRSGLRVYIRWFVLLLVAVPPYVHALAWSPLIIDINPIFESVGLLKVPVYGWGVSFWILLMALTPIAIGFTLLGLELIDSELIESAWLIQPSTLCLIKVIFPLASPQILTGGGFIFLLTLTDYTIPSLFQVNVYSLEIFAEYSSSNEPSRAFLLSVPLLVITIAVLLFSLSAIKDAALKPPWRRRVLQVLPAWPTWFVLLQKIMIVVIITHVLVLIISLTASVGTWDNMMSSTISARDEIFFTVSVSLSAAFFCLPIALFVANRIVSSGVKSRLWWILVTTPLAVPAPLIGIGLVVIWNHPGFPAIYGSSVMPVLGNLARFTPLAAIVLVAQLRRIDLLLIDAASILERSQFRKWLLIKLPMLSPGLFAAGCVTFLLSAGELGATLIIAPPGQSTLTMRIYNYLHYGASDIVAGLCLLMSIIPVMLGSLAIFAMVGWSRISSHIKH